MRIACFLVFVLVFLSGLSAQTNVATEAARFAKESQFLLKQARYVDALEKAEVAAALDPDENEVRRILVRALMYRAMDLTCPGWMNSHAPVSMYPKVDTESFRLALCYAERVLDLFESTPETYLVLGDSELRNWLSVREKTMIIAQHQLPEFKANAEDINRRVLRFWMERRYRPDVGRVVDDQTFDRYLRTLYVMTTHAMPYSPTHDLFIAAEEIAADLLRLSRNRDLTAKWKQDYLRYFFTWISQIAAQYRARNLRDPILDESLDRIVSLLENDNRPLFRIYGWLVAHKTDEAKTNDESDKTAAVRYFEGLIRLHTELPPGLSDEETFLLYFEYLPALSEYERSRPGTLNERLSERIFCYTTILDLANSRNELAPRIVSRYVSDVWHYRVVKAVKEKTIRDKCARIVSEQIGIAVQRDTKTARLLKNEAVRHGIFADDSVPIRPWKQEIRLLPKEEEIYYTNLACHGNIVYLFVKAGDEMRVDSVDMETTEYRRGRSVLDADTMEQRAPTWISNAFDVDKDFSYAGTKEFGLFIFPHDGTIPFRLSMNEGLPSNHIQSLGALGGYLYFGLGEEQKTVWLVRFNPRTKEWTILASSAAKHGKYPFTNISPPPHYTLFCKDTRHDRLLMFVRSWGGEYLGGLWSIDAGTPTHLKRMNHDARFVQFLPDENQVIVRDDLRRTFLIDLGKINPDEPPVLLCTGNSNAFFKKGGSIMKLDPLIGDEYLYYGCMFNGALWGSFDGRLSGEWWEGSGPPTRPWARVSLKDGGKAERLTLPEGIDDPAWSPSICRSAPSGKGLLVGDYLNLFLLRFE